MSLPYRVVAADEIQRGKAGEHLVCFDLLLKGYNAFLSDAGLPYDVIVDTGKILMRIQVKSASGPYRRTRTKGGHNESVESYRFGLRKGKRSGRCIDPSEVDIIACVGLDTKLIAYFHISDIMNGYKPIRLLEVLDETRSRTWGKRTFQKNQSLPLESANDGTRHCFHCDKKLPHTSEFFSPNSKCERGLGGICRQCMSENSRKYYLDKKQHAA